MDKENIKNMIAKGRVEKALDEVILQIEKIGDKDIKNDFILQSSRLKRILRDKNLGIESSDNISITINQITSGILSMIDEVEVEIDKKQSTNIIHKQKENSLLIEISSLLGYEVNSFSDKNKEAISHQIELFKINKQNLESAEKASAKWGELVPTIITHRINDEKEKISQIIIQIKKLL